MNLLEKFSRITTFIFDVDGVLTDGSVLLLENSVQARTMNIKDGLALQMAVKNNYRVVIVSGASSEAVRQRFVYLGIAEIHLGISNKLMFIETYLQQNNMNWSEVLFMGDDLPDVLVLAKAGLACCPADAAVEARKSSHYISQFHGGNGCVREVIEKVLKLNDHWNYHPEISSR
ncbi:MAG: 3-deoxy-D-manno-octulosonate 8-phosphate phosphatase [Bacteroidota bacterium]